jgi:transcription termination/antitermination protein NusG
MQSSNLCDLPAQPDSSWWALYTRHQHEHVVADMLAAKDFEVFLPAYTSIRRWKDRQKVLSLPLFPCYVFVKGAAHRRLQVVSTPGVHMVLSHGEKAAVIPEHEIHAIRQSVLGSLPVEPHPFLRCGERVRVISGSLEGVEGILTRRKSQFRLVLSVEMLEKSVSVEIDANAVEPIQWFGARPAGPQVLTRSGLVKGSCGFGGMGETGLAGGSHA